LMNEREYLKAARHLAATILADDAHTAEDRLRVLYETITSKIPDAAESEVLLSSVRDLQAIYERNPALAEQLCQGAALAEGCSTAELAAWTMLASTIYSLDITKTRE